MIVFLLFFAGALIPAACTIVLSKEHAAKRLYTATQLTAETRELIAAILLDITSHEYRFDADARREALDAIVRLHAGEFIPAVRQVAAMPLEGSDRLSHPDVVAISGALRALTDARDGSAAALNERRLHDESFRGFAVQNLRILDAWDATGVIESELLNMEMSNATGNEVVAMLEFLEASPAMASRICAVVDRVGVAYPDCGPQRETSPSFCVDIIRLTVALRVARCER